MIIIKRRKKEEEEENKILEVESRRERERIENRCDLAAYIPVLHHCSTDCNAQKHFSPLGIDGRAESTCHQLSPLDHS